MNNIEIKYYWPENSFADSPPDGDAQVESSFTGRAAYIPVLPPAFAGRGRSFLRQERGI